MDAGPNRDVDAITEQVRARLSRTITRRFCENGQLRVVTLDAEVEKKILSALTKNEQGVYLALSPDVMQQIMAQLGELRKKFQELSQTPVVLTSQVIRVYLSRLIAQFYPDVYVLSFHEITSNIQIQAIGNITLQAQAARATEYPQRGGGRTMEQTTSRGGAGARPPSRPPVSREEAEKLDDRQSAGALPAHGGPGAEVDAGAALYPAGAPHCPAGQRPVQQLCPAG